jgi:hypothetical protein
MAFASLIGIANNSFRTHKRHCKQVPQRSLRVSPRQRYLEAVRHTERLFAAMEGTKTITQSPAGCQKQAFFLG